MAHVDLGNGLLALVDEEELPLVRALTWWAVPAGNTYYALTNVRVGGEKRRVSMHRLIMRARQGQMVDHVDRNGLNNRKANLRFATSSQNAANSVAARQNTSGCKGVAWIAQSGNWAAQILVNGQRRNLGTFAEKEDAIRAYNAAALAAFGEFARPMPTRPLLGLEQVFTEAGLSPREMEIALALAGEGLSYDEVAQRLGVRRGTVGVFVCRIREKIRGLPDAEAEGEEEPEEEEDWSDLMRPTPTNARRMGGGKVYRFNKSLVR